MADDEAVAELAGAEGVERVLQTGDMLSNGFRSVRCEVVYADGDEPVEVLRGNTLLEGPLPSYATALDDLADMEDHTVVEPGVFVLEGWTNDGLHVFFACETGDEMPWLLRGNLYAYPAEEGDRWTRDTLETHAVRLAAVTERAHDCPGGVWPLTPEDGERLLDEFVRRYPTLL